MGDPNTLGIIPDGNRRYARKKRIPLPVAYLKGIKVAETAIDFLKRETGVKYVYFYTLSLENLRRRSKEELSVLFRLFRKKIAEWLRRDPGVEVRVGGELDLLPRDIVKGLRKIEERTRGNEPKVGLLIGYSGVQEVVRAARMVNPSSYEELRRHFYLPDFPDADLVLRTSGEMRLSGFLPLQAAYAEFVFYPKLWPEMTVEDFRRVLEEYASRDRRFGR